MPTGLPVTRLINVSVNLSPVAAQGANFNSCLIVGDSDVINVGERIRSYGGLDEVAGDFGTAAPEYLAADLFFSQVPQPSQLYIGRWAQSATAGLLIGAPLTAAEQALGNWTAITNGSIKFTVDGGVAQSLTGLDFSGVSNLNGVASAINGHLTGAVMSWDGTKFTVKSSTTGTASSVAFAGDGTGGTDLAPLLKLTAATGATTVAGIAAEAALTAVTVMDGLSTSWYALTFASTHINDNDHLAIAAYVEGSSNKHLYGVTTNEAAALTLGDTTSIGHLLKVAGYNRTFTQYSSSSPYAAASIAGRFVTVNYTGNNTVITAMYKQEPGVTAETLTTTQADALDANNYNYFVEFNNNTNIVVNGKVASGAYIDEIWGTDWFANAVQTAVYNLLYTSQTKIPQTDAGNHMIVTAIEAVCAQAVADGLLAPGTWDQAGFGQLAQGDYLSKGYYVYAPPISTQSQADRAARKSVPIQVAAKLAGAIHTVDVIVDVNR